MKRDSNFELLRILSIIMIIFAHLSGHGIMMVTSSSAYIRFAEGNIINRLFASFFVPGGDVGVGVFFMISGYFLVFSNKKRNLTPLVLQIMFYSVVSLFCMIVIKLLGVEDFSYISMLTQIALPITGAVWWFISAYILLCISAPYINSFIDKLSKKQYFLAIVFGGIIWITLAKIVDAPYYPFVRGVWFYLLGGFIHKYDISWKKVYSILLLAINWILYTISTFYIGYYIGNGINNLLIVNGLKSIRSCVLGPLAALGLFLLFKSISIKKNDAINLIASCCLGLYLFHESTGGRSLLWRGVFKVSGSVYDTSYFPLYCLLVVICIVLIGLLFEFCRRKIEKCLFNFICKLTNKD